MQSSDPAHQSPRRRDLAADWILAVLLASVGAWFLCKPPKAESVAVQTAKGMIAEAHQVGWLLVFAAVAVAIAFGFRFISRRWQGRSFFRDLALGFIPISLAVYFLLNRVRATKAEVIPWPGGERYFWLDDDVMISMRYALNFALGHGLVWNAEGPRVEGYTNFLWTLFMAIPHGIGLPLRSTSGFVIAVASGLLVLTLYWTLRVAPRMGISPGCRWLAAMMIVGNRWVIHWTESGSEVILLGFLLLVVSERLISARRHCPLGIGTGLLLGLIPLVRADALILVLAFLPALCILLRSGRARASILLPAIFLPLAHLVWRRFYYGDWMPNTYYLKAVQIPMKEGMGIHYISSLFYSFGGICLLSAASLRLNRHPTARWLGLIPWVGIGYATLIGGDELPELRFVVPVTPLLILTALASADRIFVRRDLRFGFGGKGDGAIPGRYAWIALLLVVGAFRAIISPATLSELSDDRGWHEKQNVVLGMILKKNTSPEAKIAHFWAGATPYFSERSAQDMLGKNDPYIARLPGHAGEWPPGHVKYSASYSLSLKPDVIVTALPADRLNPEALAKDTERFEYPALYSLYSDPVFRSEYAEGLVPLKLSREYHAVFVRKGSAAAKPPAEWKE